MPYDDEDMVYDARLHMYVLTRDCVFQEMGENFDLFLMKGGDANPSTLPERILKKVSRLVYRYLYQDSMGESWLEYLLACYEPLRDRVKEMLKAQVEYVLDNGFIADYSGVNVARGVTADVSVLRGRAKIADEVERLAEQEIPGLGYSLKYIGRLPAVPASVYRRDY